MSEMRRIRSWVVIAFVALTVTLFVTHAEAQTGELLGVWQQIEANAGRCPACQISITRAASDLLVTASNGWSANIVEADSDNSISASGHGRWTSSGNTPLSGSAFTADFVLKGARLYMTMRIDAKSGSRRVVKAVFARVWLGA
jgi:hypothetical protein